MATGPLPFIELSRERETLLSGAVQRYTLTVTNRDTVNTVRVRIQVPMSKYESSRAYVSAGSGVAANTASGTGAISDLVVTLTAGGTSYVSYTINSTYTLPTGQTYGSSTIFPSIQVDQRPTGTGVTETLFTNKLMTTFIGDRSVSLFGTRANDKNTYPDETQIAFRLVGKSASEAQAQALVDEIDRGGAQWGAWDSWRSMNMIGGRMRVVSTTAAYTVQPEDGLIINTSGANTITLPSSTTLDSIGRRIIVKSVAGAVTFAGGTVSDAVAGVLAAKCVELIGDGTVWRVTGTLA